MKTLGISSCLLMSSTVMALDSVGLRIATIEAEGWQLEGVEIRLSDLAAPSQNIVLSVQSLSLPAPFDEITFVGIECSDFSWRDDEIHCFKGRAKINSAWLQSPAFDFRFSIGPRRSEVRIERLKAGGGEIDVHASVEDELWALQVNSRGLQSDAIKPFIDSDDFQIGAGRADIDFSAEGPGIELNKLSVHASLKGLSGQVTDGSLAGEDIDAVWFFRADSVTGNWQWLSRAEFSKGALYVEPWFVKLPPETVSINSAGTWHADSRRVDIAHVDFRHPGVFEVSGSGQVKTIPSLSLEQGRFFVQAENLQSVSGIYLDSLLLGTPAEGMRLSGRLSADASIHHNTLLDLAVDIDGLNVSDNQSRLALTDGIGSLHWSAREGPAKPSVFAWQQLQLGNVPIDSAKISFLTEATSFRLLNKTRLPLLGGALAIERFDWTARDNDEHDLFFIGELEDILLEELTQALDWTPMSGTISGKIPGVDYRDNKLALDGELTIDVFDGRISIGQLASTGLFSDFSQVYGSIEIDNLDLEQLTSKFKFGGIQGRLSGFVRDLYLENWQPVTFFAWLGTPDDDDSSRRISQTAVENLASIGGGGATDLISRTFLGFFETFGYERLGIGCYLHNGVCQLTGAEPAEKGYYIVKGGGLPRIDVMGYNLRVDWNVLLERLKRITMASDDIVIE
ncbi:C4-dicarboxylate ABC transporter [Methylotuvimicrobium sp.]|uniref:C4-dicarboxylate ABC transporter n=1 Tax=Methylotuvimicrobium sp. TaxID=2822413 RepID=UPI003D654EF6